MIWFYFAALDSELEGSEDDAAADPLESLSDAGTRSSVLTIRNLSLRLSLSDVNTNDDHLIRDMVDADCYSISLFSLTMAHSDMLHEPAIAQPIVRDVHALMQAIEAFEDEDDDYFAALVGSEDDAAADPLDSLSDAGTRSSVLIIRCLQDTYLLMLIVIPSVCSLSQWPIQICCTSPRLRNRLCAMFMR